MIYIFDVVLDCETSLEGRYLVSIIEQLIVFCLKQKKITSFGAAFMNAQRWMECLRLQPEFLRTSKITSLIAAVETVFHSHFVSWCNVEYEQGLSSILEVILVHIRNCKRVAREVASNNSTANSIHFNNTVLNCIDIFHDDDNWDPSSDDSKNSARSFDVGKSCEEDSEEECIRVIEKHARTLFEIILCLIPAAITFFNQAGWASIITDLCEATICMLKELTSGDNGYRLDLADEQEWSDIWKSLIQHQNPKTEKLAALLLPRCTNTEQHLEMICSLGKTFEHRQSFVHEVISEYMTVYKSTSKEFNQLLCNMIQLACPDQDRERSLLYMHAFLCHDETLELEKYDADDILTCISKHHLDPLETTRHSFRLLVNLVTSCSQDVLAVEWTKVTDVILSNIDRMPMPPNIDEHTWRTIYETAPTTPQANEFVRRLTRLALQLLKKTIKSCKTATLSSLLHFLICMFEQYHPLLRSAAEDNVLDVILILTSFATSTKPNKSSVEWKFLIQLSRQPYDDNTAGYKQLNDDKNATPTDFSNEDESIDDGDNLFLQKLETAAFNLERRGSLFVMDDVDASDRENCAKCENSVVGTCFNSVSDYERATKVYSPTVWDVVPTDRTIYYLRTILHTLRYHDHLLLQGETGVGKTMLAMYAGHISRQVVLRFNGSSHSTVEDLFGTITNDPSKRNCFGYLPGPAVLAFAFEYWLYIDEANLLKEELVQNLSCLMEEYLSLLTFAKGLAMLDTVSAYNGDPIRTYGTSENIFTKRHKNFRLIFAQNPCDSRYNREKHSMNVLSNFVPLEVCWSKDLSSRKQEWRTIAVQFLNCVSGQERFPSLISSEVLAEELVEFHAKVSMPDTVQDLRNCEDKEPIYEETHFMDLTVRELKRFATAYQEYFALRGSSIEKTWSLHKSSLAVILSSIYGARFQSKGAQQIISDFAFTYLKADRPEVLDIASRIRTLETRLDLVIIDEIPLRRRTNNKEEDDIFCVIDDQLSHSIIHPEFMLRYGCYDLVNYHCLSRLRMAIQRGENITATLLNLYVAPFRSRQTRECVLERLCEIVENAKLGQTYPMLNRQSLTEGIFTISCEHAIIKPIAISPELITAARDCAVAFLMRIPLMICGPSGSGKHILARFLSTLVNVPLTHLHLTADTEVMDLIGMSVPLITDATGEMRLQWYDGHLPRTMKQGGLLVFDDILSLQSSVLERLNPVLEEKPTLVLTEKNDVSPIPERELSPFMRLVAIVEVRSKAMTPALGNRFHMVFYNPDPSLNLKIHACTYLFGHDSDNIPSVVERIISVKMPNVDETTALSDIRRCCMIFDAAFHLKNSKASLSLQLTEECALAEALRVILGSISQSKVEQALNNFGLPRQEADLVAKLLDGTCNLGEANFVLSKDLTPHVYWNTNTVLRAMISRVPFVLQGSQAVGKTTTVTALVQWLLKKRVVRYTNSENTQAADFLLYWRPGKRGNFILEEGELVRAIKNGVPFLNDEFNLADTSRLVSILVPLYDSGHVALPNGDCITSQPGFWFIACQNPMDFAGRKPLARRLAQRVSLIEFKDLTENELLEIAVQRQQNEISKSLLEKFAKLQIFLRDNEYLKADPAVTVREVCRWTRRMRLTSNKNSEGPHGICNAIELLIGRSQTPNRLVEIVSQVLADGQTNENKDEKIEKLHSIMAGGDSSLQKRLFTFTTSIPGMLKISSTITTAASVSIQTQLPANELETVLKEKCFESCQFCLDFYQLCKCYANHEPVLLLGPTSRKTLLVEMLGAVTGRSIEPYFLGSDTTEEELIGRVLPTTLIEQIKGSMILCKRVQFYFAKAYRVQGKECNDRQLVNILIKHFEKTIELLESSPLNISIVLTHLENISASLATVAEKFKLDPHLQENIQNLQSHTCDSIPLVTCESNPLHEIDPPSHSQYQEDEVSTSADWESKTYSDDSISDWGDDDSSNEDDDFRHEDVGELDQCNEGDDTEEPWWIHEYSPEKDFGDDNTSEEDLNYAQPSEAIEGTISQFSLKLVLFNVALHVLNDFRERLKPISEPHLAWEYELKACMTLLKTISDKLNKETPRNNTDLQHPRFKFSDGPVTDAVRSGSILFLKDFHQAPASTVEKFNSLLELEPSLETSEYGIINCPPSFFFVATVTSDRSLHECGLSPALISRITVIQVRSYTEPEFAKLLVTDLLRLDINVSFIDFLKQIFSDCETRNTRLLYRVTNFIKTHLNRFEDMMDTVLHAIIALILPQFKDTIVHKLSDLVSRTFELDLYDFSKNFLRRLENPISSNSILDSARSFPLDNGINGNPKFCLQLGPFHIVTHHSPPSNFQPTYHPTISLNFNLFSLFRILSSDLHPLILGPAASGKFVCVNELSNRLGTSPIVLAISRSTTTEDVIGRYQQALDGSFRWEDGSFVSALKAGSFLLLKNIHLASNDLLVQIKRAMREVYTTSTNRKPIICATARKIEDVSDLLFTMFAPIPLQCVLDEQPHQDTVFPIIAHIFSVSGVGSSYISRDLLYSISKLLCELIRLGSDDSRDFVGTLPPWSLREVVKVKDIFVPFFETLRYFEFIQDGSDRRIATEKNIHQLAKQVMLQVCELVFLGSIQSNAKRDCQEILKSCFSLEVGYITDALTIDTSLKHCVRIGSVFFPKRTDHVSPPNDSSISVSTDFVIGTTQARALQDMSLVLQGYQSLIVKGPTASGKTQLIRWLARATNTPLLELHLSKTTEISDLFGHLRAEMGQAKLHRLSTQLMLNLLHLFNLLLEKMHPDSHASACVKSICTLAKTLKEFIEALLSQNPGKHNHVAIELRNDLTAFDNELKTFQSESSLDSPLFSLYHDAKDLFLESIDPLLIRLDDLCFESSDGPLLQAARNGWWIVLNDINFCSDDFLAYLQQFLDNNKNANVHSKTLQKFRIIMTYDPDRPGVDTPSSVIRQNSVEISVEALDNIKNRENFSFIVTEWMKSLRIPQYRSISHILAEIHYAHKHSKELHHGNSPFAVSFRSITRVKRFLSRKSGLSALMNNLHVFLALIKTMYHQFNKEMIASAKSQPYIDLRNDRMIMFPSRQGSNTSIASILSLLKELAGHFAFLVVRCEETPQEDINDIIYWAIYTALTHLKKETTTPPMPELERKDLYFSCIRKEYLEAIGESVRRNVVQLPDEHVGNLLNKVRAHLAAIPKTASLESCRTWTSELSHIKCAIECMSLVCRGIKKTEWKQRSRDLDHLLIGASNYKDVLDSLFGKQGGESLVSKLNELIDSANSKLDQEPGQRTRLKFLCAHIEAMLHTKLVPVSAQNKSLFQILASSASLAGILESFTQFLPKAAIRFSQASLCLNETIDSSWKRERDTLLSDISKSQSIDHLASIKKLDIMSDRFECEQNDIENKIKELENLRHELHMKSEEYNNMLTNILDSIDDDTVKDYLCNLEQVKERDPSFIRNDLCTILSHRNSLVVLRQRESKESKQLTQSQEMIRTWLSSDLSKLEELRLSPVTDAHHVLNTCEDLGFPDHPDLHDVWYVVAHILKDRKEWRLFVYKDESEILGVKKTLRQKVCSLRHIVFVHEQYLRLSIISIDQDVQDGKQLFKVQKPFGESRSLPVEKCLQNTIQGPLSDLINALKRFQTRRELLASPFSPMSVIKQTVCGKTKGGDDLMKAYGQLLRSIKEILQTDFSDRTWVSKLIKVSIHKKMVQQNHTHTTQLTLFDNWSDNGLSQSSKFALFAAAHDLPGTSELKRLLDTMPEEVKLHYEKLLAVLQICDAYILETNVHAEDLYLSVVRIVDCSSDLVKLRESVSQLHGLCPSEALTLKRSLKNALLLLGEEMYDTESALRELNCCLDDLKELKESATANGYEQLSRKLLENIRSVQCLLSQKDLIDMGDSKIKWYRREIKNCEQYLRIKQEQSYNSHLRSLFNLPQAIQSGMYSEVVSKIVSLKNSLKEHIESERDCTDLRKQFQRVISGIVFLRDPITLAKQIMTKCQDGLRTIMDALPLFSELFYCINVPYFEVLPFLNEMQKLAEITSHPTSLSRNWFTLQPEELAVKIIPDYNFMHTVNTNGNDSSTNLSELSLQAKLFCDISIEIDRNNVQEWTNNLSRLEDILYQMVSTTLNDLEQNDASGKCNFRILYEKLSNLSKNNNEHNAQELKECIRLCLDDRSAKRQLEYIYRGFVAILHQKNAQQQVENLNISLTTSSSVPLILQSGECLSDMLKRVITQTNRLHGLNTRCQAVWQYYAIILSYVSATSFSPAWFNACDETKPVTRLLKKTVSSFGVANNLSSRIIESLETLLSNCISPSGDFLFSISVIHHLASLLILTTPRELIQFVNEFVMTTPKSNKIFIEFSLGDVFCASNQRGLPLLQFVARACKLEDFFQNNMQKAVNNELTSLSHLCGLEEYLSSLPLSDSSGKLLEAFVRNFSKLEGSCTLLSAALKILSNEYIHVNENDSNCIPEVFLIGFEIFYEKYLGFLASLPAATLRLLCSGKSFSKIHEFIYQLYHGSSSDNIFQSFDMFVHRSYLLLFPIEDHNTAAIARETIEDVEVYYNRFQESISAAINEWSIFAQEYSTNVHPSPELESRMRKALCSTHTLIHQELSQKYFSEWCLDNAIRNNNQLVSLARHHSMKVCAELNEYIVVGALVNSNSSNYSSYRRHRGTYWIQPTDEKQNITSDSSILFLKNVLLLSDQCQNTVNLYDVQNQLYDLKGQLEPSRDKNVALSAGSNFLSKFQQTHNHFNRTKRSNFNLTELKEHLEKMQLCFPPDSLNLRAKNIAEEIAESFQKKYNEIRKNIAESIKMVQQLVRAATDHESIKCDLKILCSITQSFTAAAFSEISNNLSAIDTGTHLSSDAKLLWTYTTERVDSWNALKNDSDSLMKKVEEYAPHQFEAKQILCSAATALKTAQPIVIELPEVQSSTNDYENGGKREKDDSDSDSDDRTQSTADGCGTNILNKWKKFGKPLRTIDVPFETVSFYGEACIPASRKVLVKNSSSKPVTFQLEVDKHGPFRHNFVNDSGSLLVGSTETLVWQFQPSHPGNFENICRIAYSQYGEEKIMCYVQINFHGICMPFGIEVQIPRTSFTFVRLPGKQFEPKAIPVTISISNLLPKPQWIAAELEENIHVDAVRGTSQQILLDTERPSELKLNIVPNRNMNESAYKRCITFYLHPNEPRLKTTFDFSICIQSAKIEYELIGENDLITEDDPIQLKGKQLLEPYRIELLVRNTGTAPLELTCTPTNITPKFNLRRIIPNQQKTIHLKVGGNLPNFRQWWTGKRKAALKIETNDPHDPSIDIKFELMHATPRFEYKGQNERIIFEYTRDQKYSKDVTVIIHNNGNSSGKILSASLNSCIAKINLLPSENNTIDKNTFSQVCCKLTCEFASSQECCVVLHTDSTVTPALKIPLKIIFEFPEMKILRPLRFGGFLSGKHRFYVKLQNIGAMPLRYRVEISKRGSELEHQFVECSRSGVKLLSDISAITNDQTLVCKKQHSITNRLEVYPGKQITIQPNGHVNLVIAVDVRTSDTDAVEDFLDGVYLEFDTNEPHHLPRRRISILYCLYPETLPQGLCVGIDYSSCNDIVSKAFSKAVSHSSEIDPINFRSFMGIDSSPATPEDLRIWLEKDEHVLIRTKLMEHCETVKITTNEQYYCTVDSFLSGLQVTGFSPQFINDLREILHKKEITLGDVFASILAYDRHDQRSMFRKAPRNLQHLYHQLAQKLDLKLLFLEFPVTSFSHVKDLLERIKRANISIEHFDPKNRIASLVSSLVDIESDSLTKERLSNVLLQWYLDSESLDTDSTLKHLCTIATSSHANSLHRGVQLVLATLKTDHLVDDKFRDNLLYFLEDPENRHPTFAFCRQDYNHSFLLEFIPKQGDLDVSNISKILHHLPNLSKEQSSILEEVEKENAIEFCKKVRRAINKKKRDKIPKYYCKHNDFFTCIQKYLSTTIKSEVTDAELKTLRDLSMKDTGWSKLFTLLKVLDICREDNTSLFGRMFTSMFTLFKTVTAQTEKHSFLSNRDPLTIPVLWLSEFFIGNPDKKWLHSVLPLIDKYTSTPTPNLEAVCNILGFGISHEGSDIIMTELRKSPHFRDLHRLLDTRSTHDVLESIFDERDLVQIFNCVVNKDHAQVFDLLKNHTSDGSFLATCIKSSGKEIIRRDVIKGKNESVKDLFLEFTERSTQSFYVRELPKCPLTHEDPLRHFELLAQLLFQLKSALEFHLPREELTHSSSLEPPDGLVCPITKQLLEDPVVVKGHTFSRKEIEKWIKDRGNHPLTKEAVTVEDIHPNYAVKDMVDKYQNRICKSKHYNTVKTDRDWISKVVEKFRVAYDWLHDYTQQEIEGSCSEKNVYSEEITAVAMIDNCDPPLEDVKYETVDNNDSALNHDSYFKINCVVSGNNGLDVEQYSTRPAFVDSTMSQLLNNSPSSDISQNDITQLLSYVTALKEVSNQCLWEMTVMSVCNYRDALKRAANFLIQLLGNINNDTSEDFCSDIMMAVLQTMASARSMLAIMSIIRQDAFVII